MKVINGCLLVVLGLLWGAVPAAAVSLSEAVTYALAHAESYKEIQAAAEGLRANGESSVAFAKPQFNGTAAYLEMDNNRPEVKVDIPGYPGLAKAFDALNPPEREYSAGIEASQLLFAGGSIWHSIRQRKNLLSQAHSMETAGRRDLQRDVTKAFNEALYQKALRIILEDRLEQQQAELIDATDLRDAGMVTSLDVRQARLSLNSAREALEEGRAAYRKAVITLNRRIGRNTSDTLWFPDGELVAADGLQDHLDRLRQALSTEALLDLQVSQEKVDAARINWQITGARRYPELRFISGARTSGEQTDEMYEEWRVGLQLDWALYQGGAVGAAKARAAAQLRQARRSFERLQKELLASIDSLAVDIEALISTTRLQGENVALAGENYHDAREQYRAGTLTQVRLGQFNLLFAEARFTLQQLYLRQQEALAEMIALLER